MIKVDFLRNVGSAILLFFVPVFAFGQISSTPAGGNWNQSTTWQGGVVPYPSTEAVINCPVFTDLPLTRNASTTVKSSMQINTNGWAGGLDFIYDAGVNLIFSYTIVFTVT